MGVESYLLSGALNGVCAQRLARTVCPSCATKYYPSEQVLRDAGLSDRVGQTFRKGDGCANCHNSGFQGRFGIYEVMEVSNDLRPMIHQSAAAHELRRAHIRHGGLTLRQEGVLLALEGRTSLEEILRVTQCEDENAGQPASSVPADKEAKQAA
jgi:type II secretory ATPase GspE/PulE/Tfp pilus assembly ATPase PilB-like protein